MQKVIIFFVAVTLLISLGRVVTEKNTTEKNPEEISVFTKTPATPPDADGDGLSDWEENIRGTDPEEKDTDKDGLSDNIEIREGRNPLVKDSSPTKTVAKLPQETLAEYDSRMAKEMNANNSFTDIVSKLQEQLSPQSKPTQPTISENQKASDERIAKIRDYGNALASLLTERLKDIQNEITIFDSAIKTPSRDTISALGTIANKYRSVATAMSSIAVPEEVVSHQTNLKNGYETQAKAIETLTSYAPSGAIPPEAFVPYTDTVIASGKNLSNLASFFKEQDVVFRPDDPGNIFTLPQ